MAVKVLGVTIGRSPLYIIFLGSGYRKNAHQTGLLEKILYITRWPDNLNQSCFVKPFGVLYVIIQNAGKNYSISGEMSKGFIMEREQGEE